MLETRPSQLPLAEAELIRLLAHLVSAQASPLAIPAPAWPEIARLAVRQGLGPLLHSQLQQAALPALPPQVSIDLENSASIAKFNFLLLQENQAMVQRALAQAGISATWLKGIALAQTSYPQPHLRPMDDLDVLVPFEQRQAALEVARSLGYKFPPEHALDKKLTAPEATNHHYHLNGGTSGAITLEIHFRLIGDDEILPVSKMQWFFEQTELIEAGQAPFTTFKPEAHFLYLCSHALLQHGEFEFRLQRFYDLHLLAGQTGMDWDLIVAQAKQLGWTYTLARALLLTRYYFATAFPAQVLAACQDYRPSDKDYIRARRLQSAGHRWETRLLRLSEFSLAERLRQLFHLTFPPGEYMRAWYAIPSDRAVLPYYFSRWWDAAREVFDSTLARFR